MTTDDRIGRYVEAATAGLNADRELRLDVQAELRSHLEERLKEEETAAVHARQDKPAEAGTPNCSESRLKPVKTGDGDAVDRALAMLGPVTAVAGDLAAANQRRMTSRARVRLALRWCLVPLAVVAALYTLDPKPLAVLQDIKQLGGNGGGDFGNATWLGWLPGNWFKPRFSPEQNLILHGDLSRPTQALQQRAIWEKYPESRIYFGNYLSYAMGTVSENNPEPEKMAALEADLEQGRKLEPDNARFDYILAGKLLQQAVKIDNPQTGKDKDGKPVYGLTWEIKDQAMLERAMKLFQSGLAKPELRRYCREMLLERLKILGPPDSMLSNIEQVAIAAGMLLPDLQLYRQLTRASVLYSEELIKSGRTEEAKPFLKAWQTLTLQFNGDSFTLIDVLVESSIVEIGRKQIPDLWLKAGKPEQAEIARQNAERLGKPVRDWREKMQNGKKSPAYQAQEQRLKKSGGILAGMLLPALGEFPPEKDFEYGRLVEYVMVEKVVLALLALLLLVGMLGCGLIYLRWRLMSGGAAIPLLLLPNGRDTLRILGYGIVLPVLGYYLYSRWLPFSLRTYNLAIMWPQVLLETALLLLLILGLTSHLAVGAVRRRCRTLDVAVPPESRVLDWVMRIIYIAVVAGLLWYQMRLWHGDKNVMTQMLAFYLVLAVVCIFGIQVLYRFMEGLAGNPKFGLFHGSSARTLLPLLALGVILLSGLAKPYLTQSERYLVRNDPLVQINNTVGGFTAVETQLVQRLTAEIRQAAGKMEQK